MKSIFTRSSKTLLLLFTLSILSHTVTAATLTSVIFNSASQKKLSHDTITHKENILLLSAAANNLSVTKYQQLSGKKLSVKNKIRYLFIKYALKPKGERKSMSPSLEGFILGLVLGPIDVLIAYVSSKNKKLRHAALAGGIISIVLFLLFIALVAAALKNIPFGFVFPM